MLDEREHFLRVFVQVDSGLCLFTSHLEREAHTQLTRLPLFCLYVLFLFQQKELNNLHFKQIFNVSRHTYFQRRI